MFAEAAAAAPQVVTAWNQVVINGAVTLGIIGGGTTVVRWLVKRWVNGIDTNLANIRNDVATLESDKLDTSSCNDRVRGIHAKIDGIAVRMDDHHDLLVSIRNTVNGKEN